MKKKRYNRNKKYYNHVEKPSYYLFKLVNKTDEEKGIYEGFIKDASGNFQRFSSEDGEYFRTQMINLK